MAYIHKKKIGEKTYYTLRVSVRKGNRVIAKDLCTLGTDLSKINIEELDKKYHDEIKKSYKTIKKFLESNYYEEKAKQKKLKKQELLTKEQLEEVEATKIHYQEKFLKLDKKTQRDIQENFLIRFAVNSTAIEGNTITLKEAAKLFKEDIVPKNHTVREVFDLINTRKTFYELQDKKEEINSEFIEELHDRLLENVDERKGYRNHDIHIFGQPFKSTPAIYIKSDIKILLDWYKKNKKMHPIMLATLFHHKFENIHPFSDGNGRTGRMIMNRILMEHKYPPIVIERKDRKEYLEALNKADKAIKKDLKAQGKEYKELINFIIRQLQQSYWDIFLF